MSLMKPLLGKHTKSISELNNIYKDITEACQIVAKYIFNNLFFLITFWVAIRKGNLRLKINWSVAFGLNHQVHKCFIITFDFSGLDS